MGSLPRAEVCAFRAASAATPFRQLPASDEIVCGALLPPALWNVFARRGNVQISGRTVLVDTRQPLPDIVDYNTVYGRVTVAGEKVPSPVRVFLRLRARCLHE